MIDKAYKSGGAKITENSGSLRFVGKKKTKKLLNSILALASRCSYKGDFVTTIE